MFQAKIAQQANEIRWWKNRDREHQVPIIFMFGARVALFSLLPMYRTVLWRYLNAHGKLTPKNENCDSIYDHIQIGLHQKRVPTDLSLKLTTDNVCFQLVIRYRSAKPISHICFLVLL